MIDQIDKTIIYLTFGTMCYTVGHMFYKIKTLTNKTDMNTEFNGKIILSIQEISKSVTVAQEAMSLIMQSLGLTVPNIKKEIKKKKSDSSTNVKPIKSKMNYVG